MLAAAPAAAQQALVITQDAAALEIGQALLAHHGSRCYAIVPMHVISEAGRPALLREGPQALLGEISASTDLGEDIAIARVAGAITRDCGAGALTIRRSIDRLLGQGRLATLRSINGDGTVAQLAVAVVDDDGHRFLRVQPTHAANPIRKGHSGSLLLIDGVTVGMLLSVSARSGVGTVARIDGVMAKVDTHLLAQPAAHRSVADASRTAPPPPPPVAAPSHAPQVLAWSALPASEANRAANLVAADEAPPWISAPTRWPVTLDLQAGEGVTTVSGVILDGSGIDAEGRLPAMVEVFINLSGEPHGWRSITSGRVDYRNGIARIAFAPMRTRLVRLSFHATVDGGSVIALRGIRLQRD